MIDVSDLLGIPYKEHGRTKEGYDCYGLVMEVERRIGIELPDYDYETHSDSMTDEEAGKLIGSGRAVRIPDFIDGAIVLFRNSAGMKHHVGVYVGGGMICHCNRHGVKVDTVAHLSGSMEGIYAWLR